MPNPYDFVPLVGAPDKKPPALHNVFLPGRHHGVLTCTLEVLSPLFTATRGGREAKRLTFAALQSGTLIIPASGLKGVIRNVVEAISASCLRLSGELFDNQGRTQGKYKGRIDPQWEPCKQRKQLCPACRLFGMVGARQGDDEAQVFAGLVQIGEARASSGVKRADKGMLITLMQPRPHHQSFYLKDGKIRGRKFYFHHLQKQATDSVQSRFNKTIEPVLPGTRFSFPVHYQNVTREELGVLIYALVLESTLAHKIGMGKSLGFGSARITITRGEEVSPKERYSKLGGGKKVREGEDLTAWVNDLCRPLCQKQDAAMTAFRRILAYDPTTAAQVSYRYPGQDWFKENPLVPLEKVP